MPSFKHEIYKISVPSFYTNNPKIKNTFSHFMFSKMFFYDQKISLCTPTEICLFVFILCICADHTSTSKRVTTDQHTSDPRSTTDQLPINIRLSTSQLPTNIRVRPSQLSSALNRLQSFQLLSYEKIDSLQNRIEENRKEKKGIEVIRGSKENKNSEKELNKKIWAAYSEAYKLRYKCEPIRNAVVNSKISQLGKRVGDDALEIVKFYLNHNDSFYVKSMHDIGLCLKDCEGLATQLKRGRAITYKDACKFEQQSGFMQLQEDLKIGGF